MEPAAKFSLPLLGKPKVMSLSVLNRTERDLRVSATWKDFKTVFTDRLIWWEVREEVGPGASR